MKLTIDIKKFIFVLLISWCPWILGAQNSFSYVYSHPQAPGIFYLNDLLDTGDSVMFGIATTRKTFVYDQSQPVSMLIAMNRQGEILWAKEFRSVVPAGRSLELGGVQLANDGNLVVFFGNHHEVSNSYHYGSGTVKVSKNGTLLSVPNYIDAETTFALKMSREILPNPATGGFVLSGINRPFVQNPSIKRHFCAQLDANGQIIPGPENVRFFSPQQGDLDLLGFVLDEEQNWYATGSTNNLGNYNFVKIKNNAPGPEWMKYSTVTGQNDYIIKGVSLGNGVTAWIGYGNDQEGEYGLFVTLDSTGNTASCRRYRSDDQPMAFVEIVKNNIGLLVTDYQGTVFQLDLAGNIIWAKNYSPDLLSNVIYINDITPCHDNTGTWILGSLNQPNAAKMYSFMGKIDNNGDIENCCSKNVNVKTSDFTVTLQDRPFVIVTDSIVNSEWPIVLSDVTLTRSSLCAPPDYVLPDQNPCTGGCITVLPPTLPPGATASWEFPAGAYATFVPGTDSIRICFDNEGPQNLRLNVKFSDDCIFPYDNTVTTITSTQALTFSLADTIFCPGACTDIQLVNSGPATITTLGGTAQAGDNLRICYPEAGTYPITIQQMQEGCLRTHTIEVTVQNLLDETPNAFTPNGDKFNETFRPVIDCIPDTYLLQIFNRWGEMVFQTENYLEAWDGTYKGNPAPMDTYIWTVNSNNVQKAYKGDVTLIR